MSKIKNIKSLEILDSRGQPTLRTFVELDNNLVAEASVPSGASRGKHEALEKRDGDPERYQGLGVKTAIKNLEEKIVPKLKGQKVEKQEEIDNLLKELDGTPNKSNLGANLILSVSLSCLKAAALSSHTPLYVYLKEYFKFSAREFKLPTPLVNVINGGAHAGNNLDIQEYWIIPFGFEIFSEKLRAAAEIFYKLGEILRNNNLSTSVGDEGGYAPSLKGNSQAFDLITKAIFSADYESGGEISLGIDSASSFFFNEPSKKYALKLDGLFLTREELISLYSVWKEQYQIAAIEDGLSEDDFTGWKDLGQKLASNTLIIGDDLFSTNLERLKKGIKEKTANAVIVKPNQIGTISETIDFIKLAQKNDYTVIISHRSGETADTFIADLAVATGAEYIKTGSIQRSERTEKYNRLLEIEKELGN